jgi:hypothetical protein
MQIYLGAPVSDQRTPKETFMARTLAMTGATPKALKADAMTPATLKARIDAGIVSGNFGDYRVAVERFGTMRIADIFTWAIDYTQNG